MDTQLLSQCVRIINNLLQLIFEISNQDDFEEMIDESVGVIQIAEP